MEPMGRVAGSCSRVESGLMFTVVRLLVSFALCVMGHDALTSLDVHLEESVHNIASSRRLGLEADSARVARVATRHKQITIGFEALAAAQQQRLQKFRKLA